jgi:hypothetical protein
MEEIKQKEPIDNIKDKLKIVHAQLLKETNQIREILNFMSIINALVLQNYLSYDKKNDSYPYSCLYNKDYNDTVEIIDYCKDGIDTTYERTILTDYLRIDKRFSLNFNEYSSNQLKQYREYIDNHYNDGKKYVRISHTENNEWKLYFCKQTRITIDIYLIAYHYKGNDYPITENIPNMDNVPIEILQISKLSAHFKNNHMNYGHYLSIFRNCMLCPYDSFDYDYIKDIFNDKLREYFKIHEKIMIYFDKIKSILMNLKTNSQLDKYKNLTQQKFLKMLSDIPKVEIKKLKSKKKELDVSTSSSD